MKSSERQRLGREPELFGDFRGESDQLRSTDFGGPNTGKARAQDLARSIRLVGIGRELPGETVVENELVQSRRFQKGAHPTC